MSNKTVDVDIDNDRMHGLFSIIDDGLWHLVDNQAFSFFIDFNEIAMMALKNVRKLVFAFFT